MGFADAVRTCLSKYVTFSGRARRPEYWWFVLFVILGNIVFGILDAAVFGTVEVPVEGAPGQVEEAAVSVFGAIFSLAMFLPQLAAGARRLHDRDMSAWWLLLLILPVLGVLILLVIFALPGTEGENRFGPPPPA